MRRAPWLWLTFGLALGSGSMVAGLALAERQTRAEPAAVVALGQRLENEHRQVDLLLRRGAVAEAIAVLEAARRGPWPDAAQGGTAAALLRHDLYGRLVRLRLDHPEVDPLPASVLLERVDEGLRDAAAVGANPFTARLLGLRGEVLERAGRDDDALGAYERAIEMNGVLLEAALDSP